MGVSEYLGLPLTAIVFRFSSVMGKEGARGQSLLNFGLSTLVGKFFYKYIKFETKNNYYEKFRGKSEFLSSSNLLFRNVHLCVGICLKFAACVGTFELSAPAAPWMYGSPRFMSGLGAGIFSF